MLSPLIIFFLFCSYTFLLLYYWQSWKAIPIFKPSIEPQTKISLIIPARNEENNIGALLTALQQQTYPKELLQIIVVDDNSTDNTAAIVQQFNNVELIQLKEEDINSYKKKAIETGIAAATGQLIVCTDADCIPPPKWLQTIATFKKERNAAFVAAPVSLTPNPTTNGERGNSLLYIFQTLDFMMLQGITGAGVYKQKLTMCNGANLAYEKKAFEAVNGFAGIDTIASGDDMLLMHKIWKHNPAGVHYLKSKETIVTTTAMPTWKAFFNQRIRWASKASKYEDKRIFWVLLLVYLFNISFLVLTIAGFFNHCYWYWLLGLWVGKTAIELPLIISLAIFFHKKSLIKYFFFFQPLHILYTIVSGLFSQFGKYEWKGRKVK